MSAGPRVLAEIRVAPAPLRHLIVATFDDGLAIVIAVQIRTPSAYVRRAFEGALPRSPAP